MRHKDGTWRWVLDRGQAVWNAEGKAVRMAGCVAEITGRKTAEQELAIRAHTDYLTGLRNRHDFERTFPELIQAARNNFGSLTVGVCDLDRFKEINDQHGHLVGDRVLAFFGRMLRETLPASDLVWRIGGDEFVFALPDTSKQEATRLIERILGELRTSSSPDPSLGDVEVSCSSGLAELSKQHPDADSLFAEADRSLYLAKDMGRNCTHVA